MKKEVLTLSVSEIQDLQVDLVETAIKFLDDRDVDRNSGLNVIFGAIYDTIRGCNFTNYRMESGDKNG